MNPDQLVQLKNEDPDAYYRYLGIANPDTQVVSTGNSSSVQTDEQREAARRAAAGLNLSTEDLEEIARGNDQSAAPQTDEQREMARRAAAGLDLSTDDLQEIANRTASGAPSRSGTSTQSTTDTSAVELFADDINEAFQSQERSPIMQFNSVLESVLAMARQRRHGDSLKTLMEGGFTAGNVDPGTMARLLNNLESRAGADFTNLFNTTSQGFADVREEERAIREAKVNERDQIRDLALSVVENGGSKESVNAILQLNNLDDAIAAAAGALQSTAGDGREIRQLGSDLVAVDSEGNVEVLYSAGGSESGAGETVLRSIPGGGTAAIQLDAQGNPVGDPQTVIPGRPRVSDQAPGQKIKTSGGLQYTQADVGSISSQLAASRGPDGYVDPAVYADAYNRWVANGGIGEDFVDQFPPENYLNPRFDPNTASGPIPRFILNRVLDEADVEGQDIDNPFLS